MPSNSTWGCPFQCGGTANDNEGRNFAHCNVCRAIVYCTTSKGRLNIIDQLVCGGAVSMEISQVTDYCDRKKIPEKEEERLLFAVRQIVIQ